MKTKFLFLFFGCSYLLNAQVVFTPKSYPVGATTESIACADFNGDGKLDLVVSAYNSPNIYMLLGDGFGGFGTAVIADTAYSRCMVSADFNKDGKADLVTIEYGTAGKVHVLFGDGAGGFSSVKTIVVGSFPFSICTADFNGDGNLDLATANAGSANISVLLGDGSGNFSTHNDFHVGSGPVAISSGDFNGDGKVDLAVANDNSGGPDSVWVLLGNGTGVFGTALPYLAGSGPYSVCSKDFNADGFADLAVANTNTNDVSVFLSKGASGTFYTAINYPAGNEPFSVVSEDFNLDGRPDLAIADRGNAVSILLGTGTGTFGTATSFVDWGGPWTIISADFNSDGRPDLATADQSINNAVVLLNFECTAFFTLLPNPSNPANYILTNYAAGRGGIHYDWNWGDGSVHDTTATPSHTYAGPGLMNICLTIQDSGGCTSMQCDTLTVFRLPSWAQGTHTTVDVVKPGTLTGIKELPTAAAVKIFPNPGNGLFSVQADISSSSTLEIFNTLGARIYQEKMINSKTDVDLSTQSKGMYFYRIVSENKIVGQGKVLIQ